MAACGNSESNGGGNSEKDLSEKKVVLDSGVEIEILMEGDGILPQAGQKVSVHYKGSLTDGQVFDESYKRGEPITFTLGTGQVIPGWDQGIAQLSKGSKAKLTIPAEMAYGAHERPGIPANSTLIFEVELIDIKEGSKPMSHEVWPTEGLEKKTTASGLSYFVIEEGSGAQAEPGKVVSVHYHGVLEDGTKFDSSFERGEPIEFQLGSGRVIKGWEEGIALLKEGAKAKLIIPPHLAYGEQGAGGVIPSNATLIFDVQVMAVK